ncbi:MAG: Membrane-fusion protein-like protein [Verrucomicrobiales bacterium]|nr:Membrane-fusion protein-like protein [Verrucomicrobiales bacterium]
MIRFDKSRKARFAGNRKIQMKLEIEIAQPPHFKARIGQLLCLFLLAMPLALFRISAAGAETPDGIWVSGITESINDVTLSSPAAGILSQRKFEEGQWVKAGDSIVELDKRLEELEMQRRKFMVDLKKSDMENSKKIFEKTISLSREEMDKKISEYSVANAEYELSREVLARRFVVAPFEGTITALMLHPGEACQAQQPLVRLVDPRKCYFIFNIDAKTGYSLKPGQSLRIEIEAGNKAALFTGTLFFVSPVVDSASGLMRVKAVFENPDGKIRPGVAGRILLQESKNG